MACSKMRRVAAERILPAAGAIESLLHALGGGKRQDECRPRAESARGQSGSTPVACGRDERPHRPRQMREHHGREVDGRCGQRHPGLRPRQETSRSRAAWRLAASTPCASSCQAPVVLSVASCAIAAWRSSTSRASGGMQQPRRERARVHVGSPRDRATERATRGRRDRDRARKGDRSDRCQREPRASGRACQSRARRANARTFTSRSAPCQATRSSTRACQTTRKPKTTNSRNAVDERQRRRAAREGPHEDRRGGEERRQPQPRDQLRTAAPPCSPSAGVAGGVLRVRHRCGRHAACSMPAGFGSRRGSDASSRA